MDGLKQPKLAIKFGRNLKKNQ